jgi:hypothetical protein
MIRKLRFCLHTKSVILWALPLPEKKANYIGKQVITMHFLLLCFQIK